MREPVKLFCVFPLKSGTRTVEVWANASDAEIVVHTEFTYSYEPSTWWVISHRRSGLNLQAGHFESRDEALRVAAEIEGFPEWKQIIVERIEDGVQWNGVDAIALREKMEKTHADYCARLRDHMSAAQVPDSSAMRPEGK